MLLTEDGSIVSGAESYISVEDASAYHAARGNAAWAALATDTIREQCLRKGTDFMRQAYRSRWQGVKVDEDQALDWPRYDVVVEGYVIASNIVPAEVKNACAELALRASEGDLLADQSQGVIREKVGQIEVEYDRSSPQQARYSAIESLLAPYLLAGGCGISMKIVRT